MNTDRTTQGKGLLLAAVGGLALTVDIPLIRLSQGEAWSVLALRSGVTFAAAILIWLVWRALRDDAPSLLPGWTGAAVACLYGLGSITFMASVYSTSTANLVFILAFNTMFAALLSWAFLGERPAPATLVAMGAMIVGVGIIVWDTIGAGTLFGDAMALLSAFFIASAITLSRGSRRDMGFTPLVGVFFPALVAIAFLPETGLRVDAPWWIVFNGAIVMPISFFCLATAPRFISGGEVAMFYLLETVLAPVWVWLIFAEAPSRNSLIGGVVIVAALVAHSLWQLRAARRRRAPQPAVA